MRSTFEKLPLEIRSKVYEELLKADNVRQPPNQNFIRDYHFETAILGRCYHEPLLSPLLKSLMQIQRRSHPSVMAVYLTSPYFYEVDADLAIAASTQIHDEAYNTLYRDNHFIVVSCNSESITKVNKSRLCPTDAQK